MKLCLACLQAKEQLESTFICAECTERELIHTLRKIGKRVQIYQPQKETVNQ